LAWEGEAPDNDPRARRPACCCRSFARAGCTGWTRDFPRVTA